jgi:hypothetical protein
MVYSTRNMDYNDPELQDLGDGQQDEESNQQAEPQPPFNLEAELLKLQKLVQAQAKEIETLKKREQVRQGKEKVVDAGPVQEVEKQPQRARRNGREGQQNNPDNPEIGANPDARNAERQLEIRISHQKEDVAQQDLRAASRIGGANPPPAH